MAIPRSIESPFFFPLAFGSPVRCYGASASPHSPLGLLHIESSERCLSMTDLPATGTENRGDSSTAAKRLGSGPPDRVRRPLGCGQPRSPRHHKDHHPHRPQRHQRERRFSNDERLCLLLIYPHTRYSAPRRRALPNRCLEIPPGPRRQEISPRDLHTD